MSALGAAQAAQRAAEREQRAAKRRLVELVEQHQREKESLELGYQERTEGIRESLAVVQRQLVAEQQETARLRAALEEATATTADLRAQLKPPRPEEQVTVR